MNNQLCQLSLTLASYAWLGLAMSQSASAASIYSVTDIGGLDNGNTVVTDINNSGEVVGESNGHAFVYSNGKLQDLGTLFGDTESIALAINDNTQVVGYSYTIIVPNNPRNGIEYDHAFLYSDSKLQYLAPVGSINSRASDINNLGQVVGNSESANRNYSPFFYSNGEFQNSPLGVTSPGFGLSAINNFGDVVGELTVNGHAYLYSNGKLQDLGTLGYYSAAYDINDKIQVVGDSETLGYKTDAFLYSNGKLQDLGTLGGNYGRAYGINNVGQIVGASYTTGNNADHAFIYSDGELQDLNNLISPESGVTLSGAFGINDLGQIAADGYYGNDVLAHGFLLTPESATPVPEPSSVRGIYTLAFSVMIAIYLRRREKKLGMQTRSVS